MISLFVRICLAALLMGTGLGSVSVAQQAKGPQAKIGISPARFEILPDDSDKTQNLVVINVSDQPQAVSIEVLTWDLDENNQVRIIPPSPQTLDQWIVINPLEFVIPAGETQTIRFAIRPRAKPEGGEHRAMIYITEQPRALSMEEGKKGIQLRYRLGVPVYYYVGDPQRTGEIERISLSKDNDTNVIAFDFQNTGNAYARLNGRYAVWPQASFPGPEAALKLINHDEFEASLDAESLPYYAALNSIPVLANTQRTISTILPDLPGKGPYTIFLAGRIGDQEFTKELSLSVD